MVTLPATTTTVLSGLSLAQPLATQFHRLARAVPAEKEQIADHTGPVTPADEAFAIWVPLFASSMIFSAGLAAPRHRDDPQLRRVEELAAISFLADAVWSIQAQSRGLRWPSLALIGAAAASSCSALIVAARQSSFSRGMRFAANWIGGLAGWLSIAFFANAEATLNREQGRPSPIDEEARAALLVSGAGIVASAVSVASRGNLSYAGVALWGLGGIALRARREKRQEVFRSALASAVAVTAATAVAQLAGRAPRRSHIFGKR